VIRLAPLALAVAFGAGALLLTAALVTRDHDVVARVNGEAITRSEILAYEADIAGEAPRGQERSVALLALMNQAVVRQAARQRGLIVAESQVQAQVDAALANPTVGKSLRSDADLAKFRERTRVRLLFMALRDIVIPPPVINDADVERALAADASTGEGDRQASVEAVRHRLGDKMTEELWIRWLGEARACASVEILDEHLVLPLTETYECR
jgi:hypothetical protein